MQELPGGRLRRLLPSLAMVTFVVLASDAALFALLPPDQVLALDSASKIAN